MRATRSLSRDQFETSADDDDVEFDLAARCDAQASPNHERPRGSSTSERRINSPLFDVENMLLRE
jgi:hypothetical protein